MLLAAAYQQLGKTDEARAAMEKGRELRPGSTVLNVPTPRKNSSPVYIEAAERIMQLMAAAGLPGADVRPDAGRTVDERGTRWLAGPA